MKGIAFFCIVLNCFAWFVIASLNSYVKSVFPPPAPPSILLIMVFFLLLAMNVATLIYFFLKQEPKKAPGKV